MVWPSARYISTGLMSGKAFLRDLLVLYAVIWMIIILPFKTPILQTRCFRLLQIPGFQYSSKLNYRTSNASTNMDALEYGCPEVELAWSMPTVIAALDLFSNCKRMARFYREGLRASYLDGATLWVNPPCFWGLLISSKSNNIHEIPPLLRGDWGGGQLMRKINLTPRSSSFCEENFANTWLWGEIPYGANLKKKKLEFRFRSDKYHRSLL